MMFAKRLLHRLLCMAATLTVLTLSCAANSHAVLPPATDLAADAVESKRTGAPLIVMLSLQGCPHCDVVRRSHLLPLLNGPTSLARPIVRQVEINGTAPVRDFDGSTITHAEFAVRHKFKLAPIVMFFGNKGEMLAKPLVGSMIPDFYGAYLDSALSEARANLVR